MTRPTNSSDHSHLLWEYLRSSRREVLILGAGGGAWLLSILDQAFADEGSRMTQEEKERLRQEEALAREDDEQKKEKENDVRDQIGIDFRGPACGLWGLTEIQQLATGTPGEPPSYLSVPSDSYSSDGVSREFLGGLQDPPVAGFEGVRMSADQYRLFGRPPELPAGESYNAILKELGPDPSGNRSLIAARDAQRVAQSALSNKGAWDFKDKHGLAYEDAGNFNYGFVMAAVGAPEQVALRFAGWYAINRGTHKPEWGHWTDLNSTGPYGDDPKDQIQIRRGYEYFQHKDLIDALYEGQRAPPSPYGLMGR